MSVSLETSLAEAEGVGLTKPGGKLLDLPLCFTSSRGLGIAGTCVQDYFPESPGLGPVTALLGQDGEGAQGQVAADALVDAAELVGRLNVKIRRQQASASAGWPALRCRIALRKCSSASGSTEVGSGVGGL